MINRKRKARRRKIVKWSSIVILVTFISLFLSSLIFKKSPSEVLKNFWGDVSGNTDDPNTMNKKTLRNYILKQELLIDSLSNALDTCNNRRIRVGTVNVSTPTLNMRSGPTLSSEIIIRIPNGTEVSVNYFDPEVYYLDGIEGQWYNITHANQVGWVWGPYIDLAD